jgi:hypothetical protein
MIINFPLVKRDCQEPPSPFSIMVMGKSVSNDVVSNKVAGPPNHVDVTSRDDSLWIKPTDALSSSFIGITTLHVSGSLSAHHQDFIAVHRHWYNLCNFVTGCYQAQNGTAPGSTRSPNCINCTNADVRLRTPDDGQKDCPKHVES